jgi:beta-lactamase class A
MIGRLSMLIALAAMVQVQTPSPLERAVTDRIALAEKSGADVAVAFETLDGRDRLLIKPDQSFHAASTMKVPVMIELFKEAHAGKLSLDDTVPVANEFHSIVDGTVFTLTPEADSDQALYAKAGGRASYRDLCESMITVSSNLATNILIEKLTAARVQATVNDLGASGMKVLRGVEDNKAFDKGLNNTTTARALLTLLTGLAKAEIIDRAASGEMVAILERQQAKDGIPGGLPPGTRVAHKTGEITRIRHDAGIVFGPRPFVLVVLVGGLEDQQASAAVIADISRIVYLSLVNA